MAGHRRHRVNELIKREVAHYLFAYHGGTEVACASVNEVELSPDFRTARIFVGVVGPDDAVRRVLDLLESERREIQRQIARRIRMRNTPHLEFVHDTAIQRGTRILQLIEDLGPDEAADADGADGGPSPPEEGGSADERPDDQPGNGAEERDRSK